MRDYAITSDTFFAAACFLRHASLICSFFDDYAADAAISLISFRRRCLPLISSPPSLFADFDAAIIAAFDACFAIDEPLYVSFLISSL